MLWVNAGLPAWQTTTLNKLHYKTVKSIVEADALSHIPWDREECDTLDNFTVKAIMAWCCCKVALFKPYIGYHSTFHKVQLASTAPGISIVNKKIGLASAAKISDMQWTTEQNQDPVIGKIFQLHKEDRLGQYKVTATDSSELHTMLCHKQQFVIRNNLLYKDTKIPQMGSSSLQFLLPTKYQKQALNACCNHIGHLGVEHSLDLLSDRFYWANMSTDVENHIRSCEGCLHLKAKPQKIELHYISATHSTELILMDFLTVESGKSDKDINILIVTDHFTRYVQAFIRQSQTARVVAQTHWDKYFMHYSLPEKILSTQGHNFESSLIAELCEHSKVKKL